MAAKGMSYMKWKKNSGRNFMTALSSALLEWLLILMLLINGVFAYLITCFARYCDLPIPCLLCSRLDHVFGSQRVGSCWDLMCKSHKSEISSLVLCTVHQKLVDVHGMCENCLFSFATKDKSNQETYRLLVGKIGIEFDNDVDDQTPLCHNNKICCCCNEPWSSRTRARELFKTKSIEVDPPLTRELRLNWNTSKKMSRRSDVHESFEDCSPHFGYSELKLDSDTESDDQTCDIEVNKKHLAFDSLQTVQEKTRDLIDHEQSQTDLIETHDSTLLETPNLIDNWMKFEEETVSDKPIISAAATVVEPSNLVDHELSHSDSIELNKARSTLTAPVGHGLEELYWQDIDLKLESSSQNDPISTNSLPESPIPAEIQDHLVSDQKNTEAPTESEQKPELSHSDSIESNESQSTLTAPVGHGLEELNWQDIDLKLESSSQSDPISTNSSPKSPIAAGVDDPSNDHALSDQKNTEAPTESEQKPELSHSDSIESYETPSILTAPVGHGLEELNWKDIDFKLESSQSDPISINSLPESPIAAEIQVNDPSNESEQKQLASTDVLDSKVKNEVNERGVQTTNTLELGDAYKLALSSRGRQLSGKTLEQLLGKDSTRLSEDIKLILSQLSLARGLDLPLTGMISPRISGNLGLNLQRISLERNDSRNSVESLDISIVSDIDGESEMERLKRQIEHDKRFMSAMYKELEEERNASAVAANQALAMITRLQEEKAALQMEALHDLRMMEDQAEYDVEALERANEILADKEKEIQDLEAELDYYRIKYPDDELMLENEDLILNQENTWLGFEDERLYISQRLSNLEKKLHLFSNSGIYPDLQNVDSFKMEEEKGDRNPVSFGIRRSLVRRVHSLKNPKSVVQDCLINKEADMGMGNLGSEVSNLNERLQALEADRNFLEHSINSLRNGEEGVRFLREIASHLQELRRVGIKRKQSLA